MNDYEGIRGYEAYRDDLTLMYFLQLDATSGRLLTLEMVSLQIQRFQLKRAAREDALWLAETLRREGGHFNTRVSLSESGSLSLEW